MFKLKLKNYRCFTEEEFDFSRVNILIGENSAGKSSILKFLLALRQSFRSPNNREYNLAFSGVDTDLGNFKEVIYNHEIDRNLFFSFEFQTDYVDFFLDYMSPVPIESIEENEVQYSAKRAKKRRSDIVKFLGGKISTPTIISFELTQDLSSHKNITTKIYNESLGEVEIVSNSNIHSEAEHDIYVVDKKPKCEIRFHSKYFNKVLIFSDVEFEKEAFLSMITGESLTEQIEKAYGNEAEQIYVQIGFLLVAQNYVSRQIFGIEYINPLLSEPAERIYLDRDRKNSRRIGSIKDVIDFLDSSTPKTVFKRKLINILSEFGIADDLHIQKEGVTKELRVMLNEINNNITDVGFGVSLQIPIFAQALISESSAMYLNSYGMSIHGQTLLIEQPEVHLHPRLQAKFIDALLGIGQNNLYIIETHSEHIIRMLQILVKERRHKLKPTDISIHYLRKDKKGITKSHHKIDGKSGKLKPNFPKGFYDVSYNLAFQLVD